MARVRKVITKRNIIVALFVIAVYAALFFLVNMKVLNRHYRSLLAPVGINVILAVSLNLTVGFLGELNLGHGGFMSIGAYAGCLFTIYADLPLAIEFPLALVIGGVVAAIFGILIGIPALRLQGDYLAIVTLAFGEIVRSVLTNMGVTGGAGGLKGIGKSTNYTIVYIVAVITILFVSNLVKSRQGRAICSIRDNIIASQSLGVNVIFHKLLAFVVAAFFAGMAGVLYGHNLGILKPDSFDFNKSIEILVMVVLGGMGNLAGSVIAAVVITLLPEILRGFSDYRMLAYAVVLITMMIWNANPRFAILKNNFYSWLHRKRGNGR